jgi:hypothetical protein
MALDVRIPRMAIVAFDALAPTTTVPILHYTGTAEPELRDAAGRSGTVDAAMESTPLDAPALDPDLVALARGQMPARATAHLDWDCPQAP